MDAATTPQGAGNGLMHAAVFHETGPAEEVAGFAVGDRVAGRHSWVCGQVRA